ncbi:MAG: DUF4443 domain-containing protein [Promethearchaeota archaeon]
MVSLKNLPEIFRSQTIKPSFKLIHVIMALIIIDEEKEGIGRYKLQSYINLPEGKVKSLINRMKQMGMIEKASRIRGHILSEEGKHILNELYSKLTPPKLPRFDYTNLIVGDFAYYSIVYNGISKFKNGIEQRDEAIKIGGTGATCLYFDGNSFRFSKDPDVKTEQDRVISVKKSDLDGDINKGDILTLGGGKTQSIARLATLAAALSLSDITFEYE